MSELLVGIDVGSTTAKIAVLDAEKRLVLSDYRRHFGEQSRCTGDLIELVEARFPAARLRVAMCGSGGRLIADHLGVDFVQEVVANSIAVKNLHPQARTAIELGGQDAKIIFFHPDPASGQLIASDMRMNGVCAGGTGAFIDEIAQLLRIPVEQFNGFAERGRQVYHVSGRCGVFAKTDIQPLLNQGVDKADLALSTLNAVAKQTIGGLAQGTTIRAPVVFEGGPLTFNRRLIDIFAEHLQLESDQVVVPEQPEVIVAIGCALATLTPLMDHARTHSAEALIRLLGTRPKAQHAEASQSGRPLFTSDAEAGDFFRRHHPPQEIRTIPPNRGRLDVTLGIDCGSTTSKFVFLDEDEHIIASYYANNRGAPLDVLRAALIETRDSARARGTELNIIGAGTTGYGEDLSAAAFHADHHAVETIAHARAALKYQPDASFVLDIGGQDMKAIFLNHGIITGITLNEACSSGCGAFIETFAASLGVPVEDIAERAFRSKAASDLGSRCTVFMRSRVVTEMKDGKSVDDVLAGLCRAIIQNAFTKVIRLHSLDALGDHIVVQGGTFRNDAILRAMELHTGRQVTRAPHAEFMGAIGIALLTRERHRAERASTFIGLDRLDNLSYREETIAPCPCCANHCSRSLVRFADGTHYVRGNRCERGEIIGEMSDDSFREKVKAATRRIESVPNLVEERERNILKRYQVNELSAPRELTIGMPRALEMWLRLPFWRGLFTALGFTVKVSEKSSYEQYESALSSIPSDTICFPAKLAHGHFQSLAAYGVDRIFAPVMLSGLSPFRDVPVDFPCPVLAGYPLVLKTNVETPIMVDAPTFVWKSQAMRERQLARYFQTSFGIAPAATRAAIAEADRCQGEFEMEMYRRAGEVIDKVAASGGFALVLCMHPYHNDPLVNHHVGKYFTRLGVPVIPSDAVPGLDSEALGDLEVRVNSTVQAKLYAAAKIAARHPNLELAQITSFGCGHDAIITDEIQRVMQRAGKQALLLKLDESDARGPLRIRITSFIETVRERRQSRQPTPANGHKLPPIFTRADRRRRTIMLPNLSPGFSRLVGAVADARGVRTRVLPLADERALALGKRHLNGDICFPAQVNLGEFLRYVERERPKSSEIAFGMHQNCKDCRAGQYAMLARKALDVAGLADVPIVTSGDEIGKLHPGFRLDARMQYRLVYGLTVLDALESLKRSTGPYEIHPGAARAAYDEAVEALCRAVPHSAKGTFAVLADAVRAFNAIPVDDRVRKPLVVLMGEILMAAHSVANYRLEDYLTAHGMEVQGPRFIDFFNRDFLVKQEETDHFFGEHSLVTSMINKATIGIIERALRRSEQIMARYARYRRRPATSELFDVTRPHFDKIHCAGEGWLIAGEILHAAAHGTHSFVIVQPFGCLPNHVFGRGMAKFVKDRYPHIQVLSLDFDPDTSMANIENRLQMLVMNAKELELSLKPARPEGHPVPKAITESAEA
ncbi:MAG: activase [Alphaproteobacteria bacterium]|nr:activase [Alphaproteobacteria bacterium]